MIKKLKQKKQVDQYKNFANELEMAIKEARSQQFGQFEKINSNLYKVKVKFNSKHISKVEYNQLLGLQKFMLNNPKLTESEIKIIISKKPIVFSFLIRCDREIEDFISEIKRHGATCVAEHIANNNGGLESWAKNNL